MLGSSRSPGLVGTAAALVLMLGLGGAPALAAPAVHLPTLAPSHSAHGLPSSTTAKSTNWAGYAVTGTSVTDVKGSWVVPKIVGSCPSTNQYASFWIGIDGYSSSTVEQTGTDSDCQSGSAVYYAWYEFYPKASVLITTLTVHPGNRISAEVKFVSGHFTARISDLNTSQSFAKNATVSSAARTSAEWIAEAPYSGGILPLANFGTAQFGKKWTGVAATGTATVGGVTGSIGSFSTNVSITMVNQAGTKNKAVPSALIYPAGLSFTVTWKSAGP